MPDSRDDHRGKRLPVTVCWHCDRPLDAATDPELGSQKRPSPGAVSLCFYCGAVGVFGEDMRLESPTEAFLEELAEDRDFMSMYARFSWARQYVMIRHRLMGYEEEREEKERPD